jgi:hypothetical protein
MRKKFLIMRNKRKLPQLKVIKVEIVKIIMPIILNIKDIKYPQQWIYFFDLTFDF